MRLLIRALKPFFYHDDHEVGEVLPASLTEVNKLVKDGYAEIVVNNLGRNSEVDEPPYDPFEDPALTTPVYCTPTPAEGYVPPGAEPKYSREPFWEKNSVNCKDCGGRVRFSNRLNKIYCSDCPNEIKDWM